MAHGLVTIESATRKSLHCNVTAYPAQFFTGGLKAGGEVKVKYIRGGTVECGGNLIVELGDG